ncbi:MAG: GNAT family N-acetyltransferase [Planctomycetota bacterium]
MNTIQLVQLDPSYDESLHSDPAFFQSMMDEDWAGVAALVHKLLGRTLTIEPLSVDQLAWGGYHTIDAGTREIVGSCAFKSEPTADGSVEIAYFTYPDFEGRGYATLMASKLISLATPSESVQQIIAHTLPQKNASTRVLEKVGMSFVGEVVDPDDGTVWRWRLESS